MSIGTLATANGFEYFVADRAVYRAPLANPLDTRGYRQGARFECHLEQWPTLQRILGL
jgi:hypothetical protein